jgi:hypothetical protein
MLFGTQMWRTGKGVKKFNLDFYININLQCMFREEFGGQGHGKFTRMFRNKKKHRANTVYIVTY